MSNNPTPQQQGLTPYGLRPSTDNTELNSLTYFVQSLMQDINVATLVQVVSAPADFDVEPASTVDVVPLVSMVDGSGQVWDHTTVFSLPFFRLQGGVNAVIVDPEPGDIGLAIFCDRDQTAVKATSAQAPPPTARRFSLSDGFYLGAWANKVVPTAWIRLVGRQIAMKASRYTLYEGELNIADGNLLMDGTQVVTRQQPAIPFTPGGSNPDPNSQAAIAGIISRLESHGLVAL